MSDAGQKPVGDRRKNWVIGLLCLVVVAVSLLSLARQLRPPSAGGAAARRMAGPGGPGAGGPGRRQMPGSRGQITAVSAGAITIQGRGGGAMTFALTPATQITVDQKPVAAAQLQVGQRARVVSADHKSADEVHVRTRPFGGRGGRGGPPGGAPPAMGAS